MVDRRRVVAVADDLFGAYGDDLTGTRLRGGDALLAELERARTGEMLDIVATIQAEQDEIIRAPLDLLIAVQGGPGTGKTAVGLHRAAFLLYNHPALSRAGVLVIGPSRAFLRYISQVLPSLGEEAVIQTTVADLVPRARVTGEDPDDVRRLKGDPRMAALLQRVHSTGRRRAARRRRVAALSASLGRVAQCGARQRARRVDRRSARLRTKRAALALRARLVSEAQAGLSLLRPDSVRTRSGSRGS